jgi:hypothetical protein
VELRRYWHNADPRKLRHVPRYMTLLEKYERAKVAAAFGQKLEACG